jgi:predicted RNA binding protein YcfA (HicA-like mRNA interferase family)
MNRKIYQAVVGGKADNNIRYEDFQRLLLDLGFVNQRQQGSHTIYKNTAIHEKMNIQADGSKAKGYQVRQLRDIIKTHNL